MKSGKMTDGARPGPDDLLLVLLVHLLDAAEEPRLDERSLLDRTRHAARLLRATCAAATGRSIRPVVLLRTGAVAHRRLAPGCLGRHARRRLALATAVRMVARGHGHAAGLGSAAQVPRPRRPCRGSGSRGRGCSPDRPLPCTGSATRRTSPDGQAHLGRSRPPWRAAGPRCRPSGRSGRPCRARARCCGSSCRAGCCASGRALPTRASADGPATTTSPTFSPFGSEHVALLAVDVVEQADPGRAVGVVLDRRQLWPGLPILSRLKSIRR